VQNAGDDGQCTLTLFRGRIKVTSTIASHSPLNISETVRDRSFVPKDHQWNGLWGIQVSHVTIQWRHVTLKGQTRDHNMIRAQYIRKQLVSVSCSRPAAINSSCSATGSAICNSATIANY